MPAAFTAPASRTPTYALTVDGRDITPLVNARLVSLTLTEARGHEADQLDLTLSDEDGALTLPRKGVTVTLRLGWAGETLTDKGSFVVDEVEHRGTPDQLILRARSADMRNTEKQRRDAHYHDLKVGDVIQKIAARHSLEPRADAALAAKPVPKTLAIQLNESDLNYLTRLGSHFDAVATLKKATLLFLPIANSRTSTGEPLNTITLTRTDGDQHSYMLLDRKAYTGVRAYWIDTNWAKRRSVLAGQTSTPGTDGTSVKALQHTYNSAADARTAAESELLRIQRGVASFNLALAVGNAELQAQTPVQVRGFKPEINDTDWLVERVTNTLDENGWTTQVEMETAGAAAPEPAEEESQDSAAE